MLYGLSAIVAIAVAFVAVFQFRRIPLCWYPTLFFIAKFIGARFLNFERVRYSMMFQIAVIAVLLVLAWVHFGVPKRARSYFVSANFKIVVFFCVLIGLFVCYGLFVGNSALQVVIDSYKFIEILVLFALFWFTWRSLDDVSRGLAALYIAMLCMGAIEIVLTERGGVGLNLCMSLVPFMLAVGMRDSSRRNKLFASLIVALVIVFTCQTRTYIIAFLVGILILIAFVGPKARFRLVSTLSIIAVLFIAVFAFTGTDLFSQTLERFSELAGGFEEAGGYRAAELAVLFEKVKDAPAFGLGIGYLEWLYIPGMGYIEWGSFVHNAYAEMLLKVGVIGLVALACLVAVFLMILTNGVKEYEGFAPILRQYLTGAVVAMTSWAIILFAAPTSTFGSLFVGPIICSVALYCVSRDAADIALEARPK